MEIPINRKPNIGNAAWGDRPGSAKPVQPGTVWLLADEVPIGERPGN